MHSQGERSVDSSPESSSDIGLLVLDRGQYGWLRIDPLRHVGTDEDLERGWDAAGLKLDDAV